MAPTFLWKVFAHVIAFTQVEKNKDLSTTPNTRVFNYMTSEICWLISGTQVGKFSKYRT